MSNDTVITVEGLSKAYLLGHQEKHDTLLGSAINLVKSPLTNLRNLRKLNTFRLNDADDDPDILWALRDVSFEVKRGETLGIIGRNGAGKSTLLKILSHIAEPTRGRAVIRGRVSALLEVGTGFHPELTGRENIYLNGTILGMRKAEIDRKFDEIVDFSGVERFIDTPVKRYSSGMQVRLAFAVAAHLEPEILIVDEVLAVGDAEFQKKCLGKMQDVSTGEGRTVLFVSHNMAAVQNLCQKTIYLRDGMFVCFAETKKAISEYLDDRQGSTALSLADRTDRNGGDVLRAIDITVKNEGTNGSGLASGACVAIEVKIRVNKPVKGLSCNLAILNTLGAQLLYLNSTDTGLALDMDKGVIAVKCVIPKLPLPSGRYLVNLACWGNGQRFDHVENALTLDVERGDFLGTGRADKDTWALLLTDQTWSLS